MEQRDYMMRHIVQLELVMKKILSLLLHVKGKETETMSAVDQALAEGLGFDIPGLCAIEDDRWIDTLLHEMHLDPGNLEKLADILLSVAENDLVRECGPLCRKSLMIYQYLEKSEKTYSFERNFKIDKIKSLARFTGG